MGTMSGPSLRPIYIWISQGYARLRVEGAFLSGQYNSLSRLFKQALPYFYPLYVLQHNKLDVQKRVCWVLLRLYFCTRRCSALRATPLGHGSSAWSPLQIHAFRFPTDIPVQWICTGGLWTQQKKEEEGAEKYFSLHRGGCLFASRKSPVQILAERSTVPLLIRDSCYMLASVCMTAISCAWRRLARKRKTAVRHDFALQKWSSWEYFWTKE